MTYRIAAVSFLNTLPLIEWLAARNAKGVALTTDLPSRLFALLRDGRADVALLPVVDILRGETAGLLSSGGIACRGAVDSVKLFSSADLADLTHIAADRGSHSSVALLQVLLAETYGATPQFTETKPETGLLPDRSEGILIIGDKCFEYERYLREAGLREVRSWDLGQLWWDLTGLPFVFAMWAVAPGFPAAAGPGAVAELKDLLAESLRWGLGNLADIATREATAGRLGHEGYATAAAIDYYFRKSLCFEIGAEELAGIRRFHDLATTHGIIGECSLPPVL